MVVNTRLGSGEERHRSVTSTVINQILVPNTKSVGGVTGGSSGGGGGGGGGIGSSPQCYGSGAETASACTHLKFQREVRVSASLVSCFSLSCSTPPST